nr:MAG TPA: Replicative helicase [Caudoviricetes sp.]
MDQTMQNLTCNSEEEYEKGGLIYCKVCNEPRTVEVPVIGIMRCPCSCQQKEYEAKMVAGKIEELRKSSLIGSRFAEATFNTTEVTSKEFGVVYNRCRRYCEVADTVLSRGIGIYLYGEKGRGKTHLTACMANQLIIQLHSVLFTNFSEISQAIRNTFGNRRIEVGVGKTEQELMNKLSEVEFLFIDDFGTEKVAKGNEDLWLQGKVYDIINSRYVNNKPTIFTSNYSLRELVENRGVADKTVDRIMEMTEIIKLEGVSYRKLIHQKRELPF